MRNTYHDRHFARSCREAFGSDLDESYEPDNWRWTWLIVLFYVAVVALVVGWRFANAAPVYERAPNQQTVVIEQHWTDGGMK